MSRTEKGSKSPGTDWWSRRPNSPYVSAASRKSGTMRWWKRNTAKKERAAAKAADHTGSEMP